MRTIIAVIYIFLYLLAALPRMGIEYLRGKSDKKASDLRQLRSVQRAFRNIMKLSGVKLIVKGQENVPKDEAVLYIGNHRGFFDIVTTYSLCPGLTGYISKDTIDKVPILGMVMRRLHCQFMVRDDIKQSLKVILNAIDEIKNGVSICIFPEGTRCKDQDHPEATLPFKDGSFKIAQKTGCKIVPIAITGTAEILENHFPWLHRATVRITYGTPFYMTDLEKTDQKKIGAYCQNLISDMIKEQLNIS